MFATWCRKARPLSRTPRTGPEEISESPISEFCPNSGSSQLCGSKSWAQWQLGLWCPSVFKRRGGKKTKHTAISEKNTRAVGYGSVAEALLRESARSWAFRRGHSFGFGVVSLPGFHLSHFEGLVSLFSKRKKPVKMRGQVSPVSGVVKAMT